MKKEPGLNDPLLVLCGPTAVGKTELSLQIAKQFSGEIIGVDSMQVYRYMDIGTAKPTPAERAMVPHHLIDIVDPDTDYTAGSFITDAEQAIKLIYAKKKLPLLTGGTGLYFKGLLDGVFNETVAVSEMESAAAIKKKEEIRQDLRKKIAEKGSRGLHDELAQVDPDSARRIHPNDTQRILRGLEIYHLTGMPWSRHLENQRATERRYTVMKIGLTLPRQELYDRIDKRVLQMAEEGLLDEVKKLLAMGFGRNLKSMQALGYRHMLNYIDSTWNWQETLELLARDTRHYAKRQFTWFNNDPEITWYDVKKPEAILRDIEKFLNRRTG